jgi:hypothetical protein
MSETLIDTSKAIGVEANAQETEYVLLPHHQNAGQSHDMKISKRFSENVSQLRYFVTTATNQNLI